VPGARHQHMLTPTDQEAKNDRALSQRLTGDSVERVTSPATDSVAQFVHRPLRRLGVVLWDAIYWGLLRNESFAHASNIAFSILMSLFPFMILVTGLAGVWGGSELAQAAEQGTGGIFSVLPDEIGKILRPEVAAVLTGSQARVVTVGSILLVVIVTGLVEALRMGLNYAYRAYDTRHFLIRRLEGTFFMLIGGVVVLGLGFLVVVLPVVWDFLLPHAPELQGYYDYFNRLPLLFFTLGVLLFLLSAHVWLPARKQTVLGVLPGVTVTMLLWFAAGWIFSWYLSHFSGYARTYAGLGGVIASLIFFYIVGFIFLLGAELNNSLLKGPNIKAGSDWHGHR
jgi:membrane protein